MTDNDWDWRQLDFPDGYTLSATQSFELSTQAYVYDVQLVGTLQGTWYAIAVPRDSDKLMIYGSNEVHSPAQAMQVVIDKIHRETLVAPGPCEDE